MDNQHGSDDVLASSAKTIRAELQQKLSSEARIHLPFDMDKTSFDKGNLRFTQYERPTYLAIVEPGCENDVVEVVKYARKKGIPFTPRGGHHAVTTTMRHFKNGICINMRPLNHMRWDAERRHVTAGGGAITDEFVRFVHDLGMEVTFGAGLGRLQGKYGFLNDNMVSCKLVLADGSVVVASKDSYPDLFWAIRGAGHNFGIAVEVTFQVYPQPHGGIHHTWDLEYTLDQCDAVFETLNSVYETMPADLAIFVLWLRQSSGRKHIILVNLVWSGPAAGADPYVQRFESLGPVLITGRKSVSWPELPFTTYKEINKLFCNPEVWLRGPYKMMGAACVDKFDLKTTREFFESVKAMSEEWEDRGWFSAMFECLPDQRAREIPNDATAFPWRGGSNHFLMLNATPKRLEDRKVFEDHLNYWKQRFVETSGYGRLQQYVSYGNGTATLKDPPEALYGYEPWRLEKLRLLKQRYDPDNAFRWYQPLVES
ncbi:FAD-linked oxidoreductase alt4 [Alternaria metachromatica]|uniref:FAD-linked oxidoreductase alt4 n=1 Tax=Alternaria metachromatica TaxID=283354 RepID=UPI0020C21B0B|nr:FAD-linked oxidoreductase alt4 [Alternaria metachromatica]KAI4621001.1 FAD-linked oxidoreductase alt4 [Alternaria metachromatica]